MAAVAGWCVAVAGLLVALRVVLCVLPVDVCLVLVWWDVVDFDAVLVWVVVAVVAVVVVPVSVVVVVVTVVVVVPVVVVTVVVVVGVLVDATQDGASSHSPFSMQVSVAIAGAYPALHTTATSAPTAVTSTCIMLAADRAGHVVGRAGKRWHTAPNAQYPALHLHVEPTHDEPVGHELHDADVTLLHTTVPGVLAELLPMQSPLRMSNISCDM